MRRFTLSLGLAAIFLTFASGATAQPAFVNGLVIPGNALDATQQPGANAGRLGFFSDLYYDPVRDGWALSDRGPGGGVLDYATRVQRFELSVHHITGAISHFRITDTIVFTDPHLLRGPSPPPPTTVGNADALNGLNPSALNGAVGTLGRSFDPEGLVIDPRTSHLIVADEYGPSVYEFSRRGRLLRIFEPPSNLVPRVGGAVNYVADRGAGLNAGRQDNRGFEGIAITPDGTKLYAVLQDPLINEPPANDGRDGRNVRVVVFDNDPHSPTYATSIAQCAYQLEPQADIVARIIAGGGTAFPYPGPPTPDPRQGRNIGLSAIVAINDHEFFVLERDNRGIGVDDPAGASVVGSKRIYKIDVLGATDITNRVLPASGDLATAVPTPIIPVTKSGVFIDLAANTLLPNGKQAEKWEGITIGPRLRGGRASHLDRQRQRLLGHAEHQQRTVRRLRQL